MSEVDDKCWTFKHRDIEVQFGIEVVGPVIHQEKREGIAFSTHVVSGGATATTYAERIKIKLPQTQTALDASSRTLVDIWIRPIDGRPDFNFSHGGNIQVMESHMAAIIDAKLTTESGELHKETFLYNIDTDNMMILEGIYPILEKLNRIDKPPSSLSFIYWALVSAIVGIFFFKYMGAYDAIPDDLFGSIGSWITRLLIGVSIGSAIALAGWIGSFFIDPVFREDRESRLVDFICSNIPRWRESIIEKYR